MSKDQPELEEIENAADEKSQDDSVATPIEAVDEKENEIHPPTSNAHSSKRPFVRRRSHVMSDITFEMFLFCSRYGSRHLTIGSANIHHNHSRSTRANAPIEMGSQSIVDWREGAESDDPLLRSM